MRKNGFTLIELIVVIIILAIVAGYVFIKGFGKGLELATASELLANNLRYTQNLAMTRGERYSLVLDTRIPSYQITHAGGVVKMPESLGPEFVMTLTNLPQNLIMFDGLGRPYVTAAMTLAEYVKNSDKHYASIRLALRGQAVSIYINPETGSIVL